jgi:hypothetical protein
LVASFACGPFTVVESSPFCGGRVAANVGPGPGGERCFPRQSEFVEHGSRFVALEFGCDDG